MPAELCSVATQLFQHTKNVPFTMLSTVEKNRVQHNGFMSSFTLTTLSYDITCLGCIFLNMFIAFRRKFMITRQTSCNLAHSANHLSAPI